MVALPLIASGTVDNILTKSKVKSLYFRAFTITSMLGEKKPQNCTKFRHYETFQVHNQRFSKIENWARKLSSLALRSAEKSIVASRCYLVFPALYLASRPLSPEGRAGIAWDHQSSTFSGSSTNRYSASRHTLLLPLPPHPSPLLVLFMLPLLLVIVHFCVHSKRQGIIIRPQPTQLNANCKVSLLAAVRSLFVVYWTLHRLDN
jgi:hypothetical protein